MEMAEVRYQPQPHSTKDCDDEISATKDAWTETSPAISSRATTDKSGPHHRLVFGLEDTPSWYTTLVLGLQVKQELRGLTCC